MVTHFHSCKSEFQRQRQDKTLLLKGQEQKRLWVGYHSLILISLLIIEGKVHKYFSNTLMTTTQYCLHHAGCLATQTHTKWRRKLTRNGGNYRYETTTQYCLHHAGCLATQTHTKWRRKLTRNGGNYRYETMDTILLAPCWMLSHTNPSEGGNSPGMDQEWRKL